MAIIIDTRRTPVAVFIQDTETRATLALNPDVGDIFGVCLEREDWNSPGVMALRETAEGYRRECEGRFNSY